MTLFPKNTNEISALASKVAGVFCLEVSMEKTRGSLHYFYTYSSKT